MFYKYAPRGPHAPICIKVGSPFSNYRVHR